MTYRIGTVAALTMLATASGVVAIQAQEQLASSATAIQDVKPSGGVAQGIKVHGDWVIDVRNPDGSLASHHEIKNALITSTAGGHSLLAGLLGRVYTEPQWSIFLWGSPAPCGGPLQVDPCTLGEAGGDGSLTLTTPQSQANYPAGTMQLSGSVTVLVDSTLFDVVSLWNVNVRGTNTRVGGGFTSKGINIAVTAGQIVQVKVVFSFS